MSARVLRLPVDDEAELSLAVPWAAPGAQASFTIYRKDDGAVLDSLDGTVERGRASTLWTAKGPEPGAAGPRIARVYFTVEVGGAAAVSPELEVYLDWVEVAAVDEAGEVIADAPFRLKVGEARQTHETRGDGTARIEGLPPGEVEVEWASPIRLVAWTKEAAAKREAKVAPGLRARIAWPAAPDEAGAAGQGEEPREHRQWVNLDPSPDRPERGETVRVRVGVDPDDGPGRKGDVIHARLEYPEGPDASSPVAHDPPFGFPGGETEAEVALAEDGGEVELEVRLGPCGGDRVTLRVGGTEACEDEALELVNWRRLPLRITHPASRPVPDLGAAEEELARAFVALERVETTPLAPGDDPALAGAWVDGADLDAPGAERLVLGGHVAAWLRDQDDPDAVHLVLCDACYDGGGRETIGLDLTAPEAWVGPVRGEVFGRALGDDGPPLASGRWESLAPAGHPDHGRSGPLDPAWVTVDRRRHRDRVRLVLPADGPGGRVGAGDGAPTDPATRHPVRAVLDLRVAEGPFGAAPGGAIVAPAGGARAFAERVVHEVGRRIGVVPGDSGANPPPPGMSVEDHPDRYEGHGAAGPRCRAGLDGRATHRRVATPDGVQVEPLAGPASDVADYRDLRRRLGGDFVPALGTCVLFGVLPGDRPELSAGRGLCPACLRFAKARDLRRIGESGAA